MVYDPTGLPPDWPDVAAVVQVDREREAGGELALRPVQPRRQSGRVRRLNPGYWEIEDGLHWVLDVVFREDRSRIRRVHAGANLAMIRRVAVSILGRASGEGSGVTKGLERAGARIIYRGSCKVSVHVELSNSADKRWRSGAGMGGS